MNGVAPPTAVAAGAATTLVVAVSGGPPTATDWVGLYAVATADTAPIGWQYLSGTTTPPASAMSAAALAFTAPVVSGSYEFRFFANNSHARLATSTTVVVAAPSAQVTVNGVASPGAVTAAAGTVATVSVSGGPANVGDWVALYPVGAADAAFVDWRYLSGTPTPPPSGVAAATLAFTVPAITGPYEFRFFAANGYARLATSGVVTVEASPAVVTVNGAPPPDPTTAVAGSASQVAIANGPANVTDWVAQALVGAPDSTSLDWRYLSGTTSPPATGVGAATLAFTTPATPGTYEYRFFANNTTTRVATSAPVTVAASAARVTVNGAQPPASVTAAPATTVTVAVTDGPANPTDWVAMAATGAAAGTHLSWQYLNGSPTAPAEGVTSASLAFTVPTAPGSYELRLLANNGLTLVATSGAVIVPAANTDPVLTAIGNRIVGVGEEVSIQVIATDADLDPLTFSAQLPTGLTIGSTSGLITGDAGPTGAFPASVTVSDGRGGMASETFVLTVGEPDVTPPVLTAVLLPPPNAAGWNNTPVTVRFDCGDASSVVATCPAAFTVDTEGTNQTFVRTATDISGNQASVTIVLNIDTTPPVVVLTSPAENEVFGASSTAVAGTASDELSTLSSVTCNGTPATISGGAINCVASLGKGRNVVMLDAQDVAGNAASTNVSVSRLGNVEAISVMPARHALVVGGQLPLSIVDDYGRAVSGLVWTSADETVATVDVDGLVMAIAPGTVAITVTGASPLEATATITVHAGDSLPAGTVEWSVDPFPGHFAAGLVATSYDSPDGTAFVALEGDGTSYLLRGLDRGGQQTYVTAVPMQAGEWPSLQMGDVGGGVILNVFSNDFSTSALVRVGPGGVGGWRSTAGVSVISQGPDATLHGTRIRGNTAEIVSINGTTGAVQATIPLAPSITVRHGNSDYRCGVGGPTTQYAPAGVTGGGVGADGTAYFAVYSSERTTSRYNLTGIGGYGPCEEFQDLAARVDLYRVNASGVSVTAVRQDTFSETANPLSSHCGLSGDSMVVPAAEGGAVVSWIECAPGTPVSYSWQARLMLENGPGGPQYTLPAWPSTTAPGQVAYGNGFEDGLFQKFSLATGATFWSGTGFGSAVVTLDDEGVVAAVDGAFAQFDANGASVTEIPMPLPVPIAVPDQGAWYGSDGATSLSRVTAQTIRESASAFLGGGNIQRQERVQKPDLAGIFAMGHPVVGLGIPVNHALIWKAPRNQDWRDHPSELFSSWDRGLWYATLGAGPDPRVCVFSTLVSAPNRPEDKDSSTKTKREPLRYDIAAEDELIELLIQLEAAYQDNLPYDCLPAFGTYNSNSFTAKLLKAAQVKAPAFPSRLLPWYPGWRVPVPTESFGIEP